MIAIKEGSIDFYDKYCRKRSFSAGQSFTESADPHNAFNTGTANARLLVFYIIKKGEPRRIEQAQPACALSISARRLKLLCALHESGSGTADVDGLPINVRFRVARLEMLTVERP